MRKSNVSKILVAILAFSLLLGAVVGITAAATEESESTVYLENSQIERNVEYASKAYLLYRVAQSAIDAGDVEGLCLQIANANGDVLGKVAPKLEDGYYVFKSSGVPAKELNTKEIVTVISGDKAISNAITWSVEEYLYARLYADGYADVTEGGVAKVGVNDGKDFIRRELYYDLLKVGAAAQEVLAPDAEDKIGDAAFVSASDALATYGRFDEPTEITLRYDTTKTPADKLFVGWEYAMYDSFGDLIKEGRAKDGSVLTAHGYVNAKPNFVDCSYIDFEGIDALPENIKYSVYDGYSNVSYTDGKLALNQTTNDKNSGVYIATTTKLDGADTTIFEADFSVNLTGSTSEAIYITVYTGVSGGNRIYWGRLTKSGNFLQITTEYSFKGGYSNDYRTTHYVNVASPIKVDGTPCELRIVYHEVEYGEDFLEFYADGKLFHTSSTFCETPYNDSESVPAATSVGSIYFNFPSNQTGTMTFDNVTMTQCILPAYEMLVPDNVDNTVVDFDASSASVNTPASSNANNYHSHGYDTKTGNRYLVLSKNDSNSLVFDVPVTYKEEGANYAILSFDYYMEDSVTSMSSQIMAAHKYSNGFANAETPILPQFGAPAGHKGKWIHVEITYEATGFADDGTVTNIEYTATATNGPSLRIDADATTGVYKNSGTKFKIFNEANTMEVPTAAELTGMRISLNSGARGDVRFDNVSFKLINKAGN